MVVRFVVILNVQDHVREDDDVKDLEVDVIFGCCFFVSGVFLFDVVD